MSLSWNEVRDRAVRFARDWKGEGSEQSERQTFWNEFFHVFGMSRRAVAGFEQAVLTIRGTYGRIDLFWPGMMLAEHKSAGEDLSKATSQAFQYLRDLVEGPDRAVSTRTDPICSVPKMSWGNKPTDGGHFILSPEERAELLAQEPQAAPFVRRYMSGGDFINGEERYCLWLKDADPSLLRRCPRVMARVELVRQSRLASKAESTRRYAAYPALFRQIAQPDSDYLAIPEVSSERRPYIPMAFLPSEVICSNKIQFVPNASLWHLGILTSAMHMAWMRQVCGRLESRYSYSNSLVYNNFPWPANMADKDRATVVAAAQAVLNARAKFPNATLADLYDPLSMKAELVKAHAALDRAVDRCYRKEPFPGDRARVEHLFALYEQLTAPLIPAASKSKRAPRKQSALATAPAPYPTQPPLDATRHFHVMEDPVPYRTNPPESAE